jgi:hypothetical protein
MDFRLHRHATHNHVTTPIVRKGGDKLQEMIRVSSKEIQ